MNPTDVDIFCHYLVGAKNLKEVIYRVRVYLCRRGQHVAETSSYSEGIISLHIDISGNPDEVTGRELCNILGWIVGGEKGFIIQAREGLYDELIVSDQYLSCPVIRTYFDVSELVSSLSMGKSLKFLGASSIEFRVYRIMKGSLLRERKVPTVEELSEMLNIGVRTFRRKLSSKGLSYRLLRSSLLKSSAIRYLSYTSLSVSDISDRLGFCTESSFRRAFKLWTGSCVSVYRAN